MYLDNKLVLIDIGDLVFHISSYRIDVFIDSDLAHSMAKFKDNETYVTFSSPYAFYWSIIKL